MAASLLWYDLETFGRHPQWDRIAQFAAVRTDDNFEVIEEPANFFCKLTPDCLPHPDACLVSGLTPQAVNAKGISEREFTARIHAMMSEPQTCVVGYNNIRFDDEFIRSLFYRNFYDPYKREYERGNSRWDIIDLVRMAHDLRPEGINWPRDDQGKQSFRLEKLAQANNLDHQQAHDALSDVYATIGLAKLIFEKQPKLLRFCFKLRQKDEVRRLLNLQNIKPLVHTSVMFTSEKGCTTLVIPVTVHPEQPNHYITYDLRQDPRSWIDLEVDEIKRRVFTSQEALGDAPRVAFKGIHINRSPALAPLSTLSDQRARALGIDVAQCLKHADILLSRKDLIQKIRSIYLEPDYRKFDDPELQIYSGDFFPDDDKSEFQIIRTSPPEILLKNQPHFTDRRGPELYWRYLGRNFSEQLSPADQQKWKSFCASRLLTPEAPGALDFGNFQRTVKNRLARLDTPARDKRILKELLDYSDYLEKEILS